MHHGLRNTFCNKTHCHLVDLKNTIYLSRYDELTMRQKYQMIQYNTERFMRY